MRMRLWHLPVRLATGAFILNSGLSKLQSDDEDMPKHLHYMASSAYPELEKIEPKNFAKMLGAGEVALGAALLTPIVGPGLVGGALTAFSAGLLGMYMRLPDMRQPGSLRPSQQGLPIAKDTWMLSIGVGLMIDAVANRMTRGLKRAIPSHS